MHAMTRRVALASTGALAAGALAGGTLAAVTLWRKPPPPVIHTQVADAEARQMRDITTMMPTDPPVAPAAAQFTDADGAVHHLSDFVGKGLVVNMWATWCAPCVEEMPDLQVLARKVAAQGILVLPLSSDRGGAEAVRKFYAAHGIDALPIWLDPKGEAQRAWGARGLPTTLIIDRQGREVGRLEGAVDWAADAAVAEIPRLVG
jgi:thiol-disulfide isomerase/thioredoxin